MKDFFKKKDIEISLQRYGIDALSAMAQGLFCSLLIGTIFNTLGNQFGIELFKMTIVTINEIDYTIGGLVSYMSGPSMAVAIGYALHCPPLVLFSLVSVGFVTNALGGAGGPLAVFFTSVFASECGKLISKETKVDIIITPTVTILVGVGLAYFLAPTIGSFALRIGDLIKLATKLQPFFMGILVSVIVGIALTLPISSAAICAALNLTGLAGGAALAGCCAQMIGFAVISFKTNGIGGLISQGIGTSMVQMSNIIKKPIIWITPILTSAITGPIATCVFHLEMNGPAISSGMGTCGLVGQIGVYTGWLNDIALNIRESITLFDWSGLILVSFVLPALISLIIHSLLIKNNIVKEEDYKL